VANLTEVAQAVIDGSRERAAGLTQQALDEGADPTRILEQGLQAGMAEIGRRFREGECYVPEVLLAARAMHTGLDVLRPRLTQTGMPAIGRVVIGTVAGDLHDIGKNLVGMMLEGAGFQVVDLGVDVSVEGFVEAVREHAPDIVGMSALITTTMPAMGRAVEALKEVGLRGGVKVVVGGAPVTREYASRIGADGYGVDAAEAVDVCKSLVGRV
jgi:5-methyltetrahydrofolate--homocysteine methyltransferase